MKYIFILSSMFTFLFSTPVETQLPQKFYENLYDEVIRYDELHFDCNGELDDESQKTFDKVIERTEALQKEDKDYKITVVGHYYNADDYYPQKNKNNLKYLPEGVKSVDDESSSFSIKVKQLLEDNGVNAKSIVTVAKSGYHLANTDEDSQSADLSNRIKLTLYVLKPEDKDSDADGVFDSYDRCENTPTGAKVDKNGCPVDSDGDGVLDYQDKCPNTSPEGIIVDADGCPLDSDGDGIIDYKDKCENTPSGLEVDPHGCPLKETLKLFFKRGSAKILPESYSEIKRFADFLKQNPAYKVKITGHTDSRGKAEKNMKLSLERAQAVKKALELEGVEATRIIANGRGELDPIASNRTEEGRAKNRRIEVELFH